MPFHRLGISPKSSEHEVLRAWRKLALKHHPDKAGVDNTELIQELNEAKEKCLETIIGQKYSVSEQEFVRHICKVLERKISQNCDLEIHLMESGGYLIQPSLHKFMWIRAVDAMEWVLHCAIGDVEFDQEWEDEIPVLCRYYNDFIGRDEWEEDDHTFMAVLNKYGELKAGGYGSFGRFIQP